MTPTNAFGQPIGEPLPGWTPRPRPSATALPGRFCSLEKLDASRHADALFAAYQRAPDGRDWTYLFWDRPETREDYRAFAERHAATTDPYHFAIIDAATGQPTGTISLMRIEPVHGVIEVGHVIYSPLLQRTRAGTEAHFLLMRHAFEDLGYRRYEWKCDTLNAPSRATALRLGFRFEGIFRQAFIYKGRTRDTAWYSIIDREWPVVKAAFEAWLEPANFDADGRQRRTLADLRPTPPGTIT